MVISDNLMLNTVQRVDVEALERELMLVLSEEGAKLGGAVASPEDAVSLSNPKESDDVLMQLAIESELALNSPRVLQERKNTHSLEVGIQNDKLVHLQELDSLLGSRAQSDPRLFALNQKQELESLLNQQMNIDHVIEALSPEELGASDFLRIDECEDPLKLFQIGNKPVLHEESSHQQISSFTQRAEYQGSLDSIVSVSATHDGVSTVTQTHTVKGSVMNEPMSLLDGFDESFEDVLDLIPPIVGNKL